MLNCRIGIIAVCPDNTINLGEIFDTNIRASVKKLYEIHINLKYLYPFTVTVKDNNLLELNNKDDISFFQRKYSLTRKVTLQNSIYEGILKFNTPCLYDISCMVPLFPDIPRITLAPIQLPIKDAQNVFIILSTQNPIVRGQLIDSCIHKLDSIFVCLGAGSFHIEQCLIQRKINKENIITNDSRKFVSYINAAPNSSKVYIVTNRNDMGKILKKIRILRELQEINKKVLFLCN